MIWPTFFFSKMQLKGIFQKGMAWKDIFHSNKQEELFNAKMNAPGSPPTNVSAIGGKLSQSLYNGTRKRKHQVKQHPRNQSDHMD